MGILFTAALASGCATQPSRQVMNGYLANPAQIGFSLSQSNQPVNGSFDGKQLVFALKNQPFSLDTRHPAIRLYLAQQEVAEFKSTRGGFEVNCLSGALSGASSPDSTMLFVANPDDEYSPNNALHADSGLRQLTPGNYRFEAKSLLRMTDRSEANLADFSGDLYGFTWVDFNDDGSMGGDEVARIKLSVSK